ncbi:MAG TPA: hypothetical protein VGG88_01815 [Gaiellaceae bacterium]
MWNEIVDGATAESQLWSACLRPSDERKLVTVFSPLAQPRFALGLETIYEGYLTHYGVSRLFAPLDADVALLLGDYLYAHGLVRIASFGETDAVSDLSELISLSSQLRAENADGDGALWAASAALLGTGGRLDEPRAALRLRGDPAPLETAAREAVGDRAVDEALAAHAALR